MGLLAPRKHYVDTLIHPTAQHDGRSTARHRAFIALRVLASVLALAAFPAYVALRGVPSVVEVVVFGWLVVLILIAYFLSRTGRYESAHVRYHHLARTMADVITCHGKNGAVLFVSPAAERLFGTKDLHGQGLFERVHVADRPAYLNALVGSAMGNDRAAEFRVRRKSGGAAQDAEFIWIDMHCRTLAPTHGGRAASREVVAVMRDITRHKEQELALEQARAEAERANAAKSRFLATMSHELRTPLNAIIGFSEMLVRESAPMVDAKRRHEYAQLINDSGHHLLSVVNGILDMSKIESGNFEITPEPFSPRQVIADCCGLLTLKARDAGIDLVTSVPDDLPDIVADKRSLNQIMLNLISNAIKFSDRGGTVAVRASHDGAAIAVAVEDTGVGIDTDDLPRLGDPFFQARASYDRRHDGTGLGLSIVKGLVALHGGEVAIESRVGEGTSVTIRLPVDCESARTGAEISPIGRPAARAAAPAEAQDNRVKISA